MFICVYANEKGTFSSIETFFLNMTKMQSFRKRIYSKCEMSNAFAKRNSSIFFHDGSRPNATAQIFDSFNYHIILKILKDKNNLFH